MGNPPCSLLLEHTLAMAMMLDCWGNIFPIISLGTEMDVGQALQPCETSLCAAHNTCPTVHLVPPIFTRPLRSTISFPSPLSPETPARQRWGGCSLGDLPAQNCISPQEIKLLLADMEENWLLIF